MLHQYAHTLRLLTEAPSQTRLDALPLLNPHDREEVFRWHSRATAAVSAGPGTAEKSLHEVFSAQARVQPQTMAVQASDRSATYRYLDQTSDRLARELPRRGVSSGRRVALRFEKGSLWAIVAMLAAMKAGGACVPIDYNTHGAWNDAEIAAALSSADVKLVLTSDAASASSAGLEPDVLAVSARFIARLPEAEHAATGLHAGLGSISDGEDLAYVAFTDGSTKLPEGVMLQHGSLVSTLTSLAQQLGWREPGLRMLQSDTYASSISIVEISGALLFGGCLCMPSEEEAGGAGWANLTGFIGRAKVNWALLPPIVLRDMSPGAVPGLHSVLSVGEPARLRP